MPRRFNSSVVHKVYIVPIHNIQYIIQSVNETMEKRYTFRIYCIECGEPIGSIANDEQQRPDMACLKCGD